MIRGCNKVVVTVAVQRQKLTVSKRDKEQFVSQKGERQEEKSKPEILFHEPGILNVLRVFVAQGLFPHGCPASPRIAATDKFVCPGIVHDRLYRAKICAKGLRALHVVSQRFEKGEALFRDTILNFQLALREDAEHARGINRLPQRHVEIEQIYDHLRDRRYDQMESHRRLYVPHFSPCEGCKNPKDT